jgi:RHS repeat-associated protein
MTNGLQVSTSGASATSLSYDLNGNLLNDGTNSYAWDAENRMIKITYPGTGNYSAFSYDGLSRNVAIVETTSGSVTSTKQFVWGGMSPSEERDASGTLIKRFYKAGKTISGTSYFYSDDHVGSVREVTSSSGSIQSDYGYDPYGRITYLNGSSSGDFQYANYYFHAPSSLSLTLTRPYNSTSARWLCRDMIGEKGGVNLYAYVGNNPITFDDPLGMACSSCSGGLSSRSPDWPLPWPPDPPTGRPGEAPFFLCKYANSAPNCDTCCHNKFNPIANDCFKRYGPNGCSPNPQLFKNCMDWARQYLEFCIRRCSGGWGWDDPTPPPSGAF